MKVIRKRLPNGLRIILVPMKDSATCTLSVAVEAGSNYESKEESGISHFLEHMCFKGTKKRPLASQISLELDELGAQYNASTSRYYTEYYVKALPECFTTVLDIVADLYLNPTFPEVEIEKEKQVVCDEIDMYEDDVQSVASELLTKTMFGDQPAGWSVAGTKENVRNFTRRDILQYRKKHYIASKTIVTISGDFDSTKAFSLIKKAFTEIKTAKGTGPKNFLQPQYQSKVCIKEKQSEQTHIRIAYPGFAWSNQNRIAAGVLGAVLGGGMTSRLFTKLREEMGVSYYSYAQHGSNIQYGSMYIGAGVHPSVLSKTIDAIQEECKRLAKELVLDKELNKIKQMYIASLKMGLETSNAVSDYVLGFELKKEKILLPKELEKRIMSVSKEQVQSVAKEIFNKEAPFIVVVGPHKKSALKPVK